MTEPADSVNDNVMGDLIDSFSTGIFSHFLMSILFGKSKSYMSLLNKNELLTGVKLGGAIAGYRRLVRPMVSKTMDGSTALKDFIKM